MISICAHTTKTLRLTQAALATALLVALGAPTAVLAEEPEVIEEIIVTALKRETNLLETPLAISAMSGEMLEQTGADGLEEFLQFAPGTSIERSNQGSQVIYIRGLASSFGNSPIGMYIDEVPFTALTVTWTPDVRAWDLERVEVLRGPQGTLYGASSLGGTIRVLTKDPVYNEFQAKAEATYSETDGSDSTALKGAVNIPIVEDALSLRIAATTEELGGYLTLINGFTGATEDDFNDYDVDTARIKLKGALGERAEFTLAYWMTDSLVNTGSLANDDLVTNTLFNATDENDLKSDLYSAEFNIDFDGFSLTSSTSWFDIENNISFVDFGGGFSDTSVEIFNQELRLTSSGDGNLLWTLGGIYTENETFVDFFFNLPGFFVNTSTQDNDSESWAIYGEATYSLNEHWDVTLGLRYYDDEVTRNDTQFMVPTPEIKTDFDDVSPRLNVAWKPNPDTLLFATASKGFRSGLTQPSIAIGAAAFAGLTIPEGIDSEDAINYEIGGKFKLADGRVTLDLVAYTILWEDLQSQIFINPVVFSFLNAGDATGRGIEFAASWAPTENLLFNLSGNVNKTEYDDTLTDAFGRVVFEDGNQVQLIPEHTITASVDYTLTLGGGWVGSARASVEHVDERTTTDDSLTRVSGDDNTRVNLRIGAERESFGVYLFAENLTDDDNRLSPAGTALANSGGYASRYRPRTLGITLRYDH